ncbi:hypothetical protein AXF42_Ash013150 [Apostasia shenzhenica]|uniref:Uncharacterized protein n=1 Tax=Apostasia shenzhenica TaxID=1088818 RepID=A0A2I0BD81_9ASPA|nr:hypothetical protein AXF42_Ash013150 [Apostasia shenzhenica]
MTTNTSECFNGILKHARGLPIQALVCVTYYRTVDLFLKRQKNVVGWESKAISPYIPRVRVMLRKYTKVESCAFPIRINYNELEVNGYISRK